MVETEAMVVWLYRNRPLPVARWKREATVVNN
jgi:hypothetical protein